jgi:hypothetical protein
MESELTRPNRDEMPAGSALLDHRLFLPESWCEPTGEAKVRRAKAHIPEGLPFRTKPRGCWRRRWRNGVEAGAGDRVGRLPPAAERSGREVARQDLAV